MGETFITGVNPGGIVEKVTEEDGELILEDEMPGEVVDKILDENEAYRNMQAAKTGPSGNGVIGARIPLPTYMAWQKEYREGPKKWGVKWHVFLKRRLNSGEFSKFVFQKL